jgi:hypothetical protein
MAAHSFTGENAKNKSGVSGVGGANALAAELVSVMLRIASLANRDFGLFAHLFQCAPAEGNFRQGLIVQADGACAP